MKQNYYFAELKTDDWTRYNYYDNFDLSFENLPDNIDRIDAATYSFEDFVQNYEKPYMPVIIKNSQTNWQAKEKWTLDVCS